MCLLSYKFTDDWCLALLLFSLHLLHTEWVVFWPVNTSKEFLLSILLGIPQSRTYCLLMTSQVMSWTSAGQRSSCKFLFIHEIIIDGKISLLLLKTFILWSSAKLTISVKNNSQNGCHVQGHKYLFSLLARFLKPTLFQVQQLDVFYHVFLIPVLGIQWHKCLTNLTFYFTAMALLEVSLGSCHFYQVGHRVIEEVPKATKIVGLLCSWADKDKQEKIPESTLKILWNSLQACQSDTRTS